MQVKILKDDDRLGIKKGEVYNASGGGLGSGKVFLLGRVPDGYDPECSQYKYEVAVLFGDTWKVIRDGKYETLEDN
jgi:hypothetical protein